MLGLDLNPLPVTVPLPPHVSIMRQDVFDWKIPVSVHAFLRVVRDPKASPVLTPPSASFSSALSVAAAPRFVRRPPE